MAQTVIGIFSSSGDAQSARQELLSRGIDDTSIDMSEQRDSDSSNRESRSDDDDNDLGDRISRFFSNLFGDDDDSARNYSSAASRGIVLTVHARDRQQAEEASEILDNNGAVDINDYAADYTRNVQGMGGTEPFDNDTRSSDSETNSIPVIEEELQVGKREVEAGGKRVRSRIIEQPIEETLRLREERVNIERNPVDRVATDAELSGLSDQTIEVVEHREVPVVNKEARVVEEIRVSKDVDQREERISDTVRHTEIDVEDIEANSSTRSAGTTDPDYLDDTDDFSDSDDGLDSSDRGLRR